MTVLTMSDGDHEIQAFPIKKGWVGKISGSYTEVSVVHCVVSGDIDIEWNDGSEDTISCLEGDDFSIVKKDYKQLTISSGTFHLA